MKPSLFPYLAGFLKRPVGEGIISPTSYPLILFHFLFPKIVLESLDQISIMLLKKFFEMGEIIPFSVMKILFPVSETSFGILFITYAICFQTSFLIQRVEMGEII